MQISVENAIFKRVAPVKKLFSQGVTVIAGLPNGDFVVGAGDGTLAKISIQDMTVKCASQVPGGVTSISLTSDATHFFCGTSQCNIYWVDSAKLNPELRNACHYDKINDVAFP